MRHPHVLQLIMDSLRYWVEEMHVDGFRFDLAATLARELHDVDRLSAFFDLIQQDPVVSQVKLIAEPWDVGEGGYQVGNFPPLWSEWNGRYRDCVRDVWRPSGDHLGEFAARLTGSSDLYEDDGRRPHASINFVTAHDGFTLADLVTYEQKHNLANGEDNRDGTDDNRSWNGGIEGPTDLPEVRELRARQQRNLLATLLLSQGVPMLLARRRDGPDPAGQQQRLRTGQRDLLGRLVLGRRGAARVHATCSSRCAARIRCCTVVGSSPGRRSTATSCPTWRGSPPTAQEMTSDDWHHGARSVTLWLNGDMDDVDQRGEPVGGATLIVCCNLGDASIDWRLPAQRWGAAWHPVLDTSNAAGAARPPAYGRGRHRRDGSQRRGARTAPDLTPELAGQRRSAPSAPAAAVVPVEHEREPEAPTEQRRRRGSCPPGRGRAPGRRGVRAGR